MSRINAIKEDIKHFETLNFNEKEILEVISSNWKDATEDIIKAFDECGYILTLHYGKIVKLNKEV